MTRLFTTGSSADTQRLGEDIARKFKGGGILALYGDLGSGKTTFVQGLAKGLGINQKIISPTFIIARKYELGENNFYHIDLYRIEKIIDVESIGLSEILNDRSNVVAIEWPEKIEKLLPKNTLNINFKYLKGDQRRIEFK